MKLQVKPIYGYGWFDAKGDRMEVPHPFELEVQIIEAGNPLHTALGLASMPDHPLSGLWILLSQRHTTNDGYYSLNAFSKEPVVHTAPTRFSTEPHISGFALAAIISN